MGTITFRGKVKTEKNEKQVVDLLEAVLKHAENNLVEDYFVETSGKQETIKRGHEDC